MVKLSSLMVQTTPTGNSECYSYLTNIIPPDEPLEYATFKKSENLIVNCLAGNVLEVLKEKTTAKEIIDTFRGIYGDD